ncbi:MAG TPA: iron-sulfur cluster repair di-iron protein [Terriglobales bacterium]|nr:iron-sulfur cluster repair di-iron protein [Terriglobales bacterium]
MTFDESKTVREFALAIPSATKVFEKLGIDYCCGGGKKLGEACVQAKLPVEQVLQQLEQAESSRLARNESGPDDWSTQPLADLIDHIVKKHHEFVKAEIPRLSTLADKVAGKHGPTHPETAKVNELFETLADELSMHLMKEEQILFPYIVRMEEAVLEKAPVLPPPFGTVQNPVRMMVSEHDSAGTILRELRAITSDYKAPEDACTSYRTLYNGLLEFEADLHQHIHLENNVLFPRAIAMEDGR